MDTVSEAARDVTVVADADVVVCGGGPAGFAAAIAAARGGATTVLLEVHGCLGGVWTAGALSWVLDASSKTGVLADLITALDRRHARVADGTSFGFDVEVMKLVLDEMALTAGVHVQLHSRVVAALPDAQSRLAAVVTESKSGRQAWTGRVFIDATGDGDVAALAGCGYDYGHPDTGEAQPMTLMALLTGIDFEDVVPFVAAGGTADAAARASNEAGRFRKATTRLLEELTSAGVTPSYALPTLSCIHHDLFALMANHEYGASALDAGQITQATMRARAEVHRLVAALRSLGGPWAGLRLVATGSQIGVREGRRIHGRYRVGTDDLMKGVRHPDGICRVTYGVDVHSLSAAGGGALDTATDTFEDRTKAYDIPLRALIARDVDGLLLAGRCISGDFLAHSSYRVTGNAVAMGQAAGATAAIAAASNRLPHDVSWNRIQRAIEARTAGVRPADSAILSR